ncbi:peptide chain release factor N(5)-glutamine methyltransferase [Nocardioides acrostichi]|uniref:Release factor glutamine methyltransferase n=1 Tax=Nocardioides acrostichi TaxID=2784339 RepID=A0A930V2I8_9ACTN|nr:peptide chain release factor N(5)-glutamine methyltransferase [Nocardioides acrostichi]MBF4162824.1 peptide chain release factor N(5)-glutamine methyltransferase [Nocardioides acrostichi]
MTAARALLRAAQERLAVAGVASPGADAAELLAHVLGISRGRLPLLDDVAADRAAAFEVLISRREAREPLQHLTGVAAFRYVELDVGPGVFVPRPETELLAGWAIEEAMGLERPVVVDLCTGSGAIARSIAHEVPHARVHAVELDPAAHAWAERNLADTGVDLRLGDAFDAFEDLRSQVDIVVCNPPYVPLEAWESVVVEARDHDPHLALFSGGDGLDAIRLLERHASRLLRPGGVLGFEHADVQGQSAPAVLASSARWREVRDHDDLAGRPRFTTARLAR